MIDDKTKAEIAENIKGLSINEKINQLKAAKDALNEENTIDRGVSKFERDIYHILNEDKPALIESYKSALIKLGIRNKAFLKEEIRQLIESLNNDVCLLKDS